MSLFVIRLISALYASLYLEPTLESNKIVLYNNSTLMHTQKITKVDTNTKEEDTNIILNKDLNDTNFIRDKRNATFCGFDESYNTGRSLNQTLHHRVKRYRLQGTKWEKLTVTWTLATPSSKTEMSNNDHKVDLYRAFKLWSDVSKLEFQEVHPSSDDVDIKIGFFEDSHGDPFPFDGTGDIFVGFQTN